MINSSIFRCLVLCSIVPGILVSLFEKVSFSCVKAQSRMEIYLNALAKKIDPKVTDSLSHIEGTPRRLLALRGYIRSRSVLKLNWSWNSQEIAQYKKSAEYRMALAEVDKVKSKFADLNPGYSIEVNTEVRTLDAQIASWNREKSVSNAAEELFAAAQKELSNPIYKEEPDQISLNRFQEFLKNQKISDSPTVATPGLSQHGQLRAFDFRIKQGSQIIADTQSSTINSIWDGEGWTQKLKTAVSAASQKFRGPLTNPREPWHYTYIP
jgi:hypothetical protein